MTFTRRIARQLKLARRNRRRADQLHRAALYCAKHKLSDGVEPNTREARKAEDRARYCYERAIALVYEEANDG